MPDGQVCARSRRREALPDLQRRGLVAVRPERFDFTCPFCGASAAVDGDKVAHVFPVCPKFVELAPADYLAAVNVARRRKPS
jgi:hypothetical protein